MAVGVALRSAVRLALLLTGLMILFMWGMVHAGYISVDWGAISHSVESGAKAAGGLAQLAVADLSAQLAGFGAGVLLGFKMR